MAVIQCIHSDNIHDRDSKTAQFDEFTPHLAEERRSIQGTRIVDEGGGKQDHYHWTKTEERKEHSFR